VYYRFSFPEGLVFQFQDIPYFLQLFAGDGVSAVADLPVKGVLVCGGDSLWDNKNISLFFHAKGAKEKSTQNISLFFHAKGAKEKSTQNISIFFHAKGAKEKSMQNISLFFSRKGR
jgi:hypothetical protein